MSNDIDSKGQILSDDALNEKNQILDKLKSKFNFYSEDNHGCGYTKTNEWNPFIHDPTLDTFYIYKNQKQELYNSILESISGKISKDIELFEIKDCNNPHRILHPIDLPCYAIRYIGQPIKSKSDRILLGEITGFVYRKNLQNTGKYFNLKLINEELPSYILDVNKSSNMLRFISDSSLGPLFSNKRLVPNIRLHTIYVDNWPHIIASTIPGVDILSGDQLIADFSSLKSDNKSLNVHNVYNGLGLNGQGMIIPVLGVPLGVSVSSVINKREMVGTVADFVEKNDEKFFLVNYPNGEYELYTRVALMVKLLRDYLKDSRLEELLVPISDRSEKLVRKKHESTISGEKSKVISDGKLKNRKDKSKSSISPGRKLDKNVDKNSKYKVLKTSNSVIMDKNPVKLDSMSKVISSSINKDSNNAIVTRSRRSYSSDLDEHSLQMDNVVLNSKDNTGSIPVNVNNGVNNLNKIDKKPIKLKKVESKSFEPVSFRRNSPQEVKDKVSITTLKDYCIDTLLELSRTRKNWRDCDNRKQFNFHFAKISNAKDMEDLEPQFTQVFYKLYQYVDLTIASGKVTFDAVGSCEKENPQLVDHLIELLTNIYTESYYK